MLRGEVAGIHETEAPFNDDDDKAVWVGDGADTEGLEPPQCYNYLQSDTGGVNITFNITPK